MKQLLCIIFMISTCVVFGQKKPMMIVSTEKNHWINAQLEDKVTSQALPDVIIDPSAALQTIEGFGGCFNEMGWVALNGLSEPDRKTILKDLFLKGEGMNFTICRMPIGANDFSTDWYSYDETDYDFDMKNFSISHDLKTLIPFIQSAKVYAPTLKLWASPWSPPSWMKWNKHYACASNTGNNSPYSNGLTPEKQGKEGTNQFMAEDNYLKSYALYFGKFIESYQREGIQISTVMPQNEFNSCQIFPSCTWTAKSLALFIGKYLGPEMKKHQVDILFGTMERPSGLLVDTILNDPLAGKFVKGVGFQWAGKGAIQGIHQRYPGLTLYQSEQECGDGKNDWNYCKYAWTLMKHYLSNGANAYMYWNIALEEGGISRWGWSQNSLITVDSKSKTYKYTHEYYLLKHVSHFVYPGAKLLKTEGSFSNLLAFKNPDGSIVLVLQNDKSNDQNLSVKFGNKVVTVALKADSFTTLSL